MNFDSGGRHQLRRWADRACRESAGEIRHRSAPRTSPYFVKPNGPTREARFNHPDGSPDGGVHALFVISGRQTARDASGCTISGGLRHPGTEGQHHLPDSHARLRAGLIESIPTATSNNPAATANGKAALGIGATQPHPVSGSPNTSGNDCTITRFGWKAQNKSLVIFSGEAYNVEQGITSELFSQEREETPGCQFATVPNDTTNPDAATPAEALSGPEKFAAFMRFLAPPTASKTTPGGATSIASGKSIFMKIGCAYCHTPTLYTGNATVAALATSW
jgi:hypothetical protein